MLKVDSLSFSYAQVKILHEISFEVKSGEILQVQGPNGVGKSTFLALLAGLLPAPPNSIRWRGEGSASEPQRFFGYLSAEANGLYLQMNAYNNLRFWFDLGQLVLPPGSEESHLRSALTWWGLEQRYLQNDLAVGYFSTGMRRRLALARLSLGGARCWLLDEPSYGLDQRGLELFRQSLAAHSAAGGCAIVVSHDVSTLQGVAVRTMNLLPHREGAA